MPAAAPLSNAPISRVAPIAARHDQAGRQQDQQHQMQAARIAGVEIGIGPGDAQIVRQGAGAMAGP